MIQYNTKWYKIENISIHTIQLKECWVSKIGHAQSGHGGYLTSFATKWQLPELAAVDLYKQDCLGWRLSHLVFCKRKNQADVWKMFILLHTVQISGVVPQRVSQYLSPGGRIPKVPSETLSLCFRSQQPDAAAGAFVILQSTASTGRLTQSALRWSSTWTKVIPRSPKLQRWWWKAWFVRFWALEKTNMKNQSGMKHKLFFFFVFLAKSGFHS